MKITIEHIKDNPDGSADVFVEADDAGTTLLLERGLIAVLTEGLDMRMQHEEEQAWEEAQRLNDIQERNKAAMGAWNAAGMFITENADKLGRLSLREAYEKGFLEGYKFAKEK
jgi:hypothetical protein